MDTSLLTSSPSPSYTRSDGGDTSSSDYASSMISVRTSPVSIPVSPPAYVYRGRDGSDDDAVDGSRLSQSHAPRRYVSRRLLGNAMKSGFGIGREGRSVSFAAAPVILGRSAE